MPPDFVQHKEPKLLVDGLDAGRVAAATRRSSGARPGHGDIYPALLTSGMLDTLLERGYRYAFISNSDNLGRDARPADPRLVRRPRGCRTLCEVTDRTEADRKGGHIAVLKETGGLILRETAQTPDEDMDAFTDVDRHPYFHVNNLWVDLRALDALLRERDGVLGLPMIVNEKTVDPADPSSPAVVPARDGDGRGDRRVRGRAGDPRAALALRAREEDERPARAALRRLRARRGGADRARARARRARRSSSSTTSTSSCSTTSTRASRPGRRRSSRRRAAGRRGRRHLRRRRRRSSAT